jgi:hypothetical protein
MKRLLIFAFLFAEFFSFGQNGILKGNIKHGISLENSQFVNIELLRNPDNKKLTTTFSDTTGNFELLNIPQGNYILCFSFVGYQEYKLADINIYSDSTTIVEIYYPCPTGSKISEKKCPLGHTNDIIPIVYGLPSEKGIKKAEKGKIELGGCSVTECDPKWYCKIHKIKF